MSNWSKYSKRGGLPVLACLDVRMFAAVLTVNYPGELSEKELIKLLFCSLENYALLPSYLAILI